MLSLKIMLVSGFVGFPLISIALILTCFWYFAYSYSEEKTRTVMTYLVNGIADRVEEFFDTSERAAVLTERLAASGLLDTAVHEQVERFFFEQLRLNPEVTGLFFGTLDGEFVFVTRDAPDLPENGYFSRRIVSLDGVRYDAVAIRDQDFAVIEESEELESAVYDPRLRPWFIQAFEMDTVVWTEPYVFFTARMPGLSTATVAYDDGGEPIGVVGADIGLTHLADFLERQQQQFPGHIALLTSELDVISSPGFLDATALTTPDLPPLSEAGPPTLQAVAHLLGAASIHAPGVEHHRFEVDDENQLAAIRAVSGAVAPWIIGVTLPDREVFGWFVDVGWATTLAALALSALSCGTGLLLWRTLNRRLAGLRMQAAAIAQGDYRRRTGVTSRLVELHETEIALNLMAEAIARRESENHRLLREIERLAEAVRQVGEAILLADADGAILYVNPAFESLSGFEVHDLIGRRSALLLGAMGANGAHYEAMLAALREGRQWEGSTELLSNDRVVIPVFLIASPVPPYRRPQATWVAVIRDLRDQRRTEAALRMARDHAIETSQAKSAFLARISHELRTPLNAIIGFSALMASEYLGGIGHPKYRNYVQDIGDAADTLHSTIDNILTHTELDSGKVTLTVEPTLISPLLDEVCKRNLASANRRNIAITAVCDVESGVMLDRTKVRQMLSNLVANAINVAPSGSTVRLDGYFDDQGRLCLSVTDAGPGMTSEKIGLATQHFEDRVPPKADLATEAGLGMGIPIAIAVADLHGANLRIRSAPGDGTIVQISFPVDDHGH